MTAKRLSDKWRDIAGDADLLAFSENTSLFDKPIRALEQAADAYDELLAHAEAMAEALETLVPEQGVHIALAAFQAATDRTPTEAEHGN